MKPQDTHDNSFSVSYDFLEDNGIDTSELRNSLKIGGKCHLNYESWVSDFSIVGSIINSLPTNRVGNVDGFEEQDGYYQIEYSDEDVLGERPIYVAIIDDNHMSYSKTVGGIDPGYAVYDIVCGIGTGQVGSMHLGVGM